ncbi:MAG: ATP-binding cassette domain-containing protein [Desulfobacterales bacterium]
MTKSYRDPGGRGRRPVLRGIQLALAPGMSLGVMGPSGSGKSTLARLLVGLERLDAGEILLHGRRIDPSRRSDRRRLRQAVQIVWQDPLLHLNPFLTVGQALAEALRAGGFREQGGVEKLCDAVQLPRALLGRRPDRLSGGEAQRVVLARALAVAPEVLICDEALCGLDLPVQVCLMELLRELRRERRMALLFISHDFLTLAALCEELAVLSGGVFVESGPPRRLRGSPRHEVTRSLVSQALSTAFAVTENHLPKT